MKALNVGIVVTFVISYTFKAWDRYI